MRTDNEFFVKPAKADEGAGLEDEDELIDGEKSGEEETDEEDEEESAE